MKKYISALFAVLVCLFLTLPVMAYEVVDASDVYEDVAHDAWYRSELSYALVSGVIEGSEFFNPEADITLSDFVCLLGRVSGVDYASEKLDTLSEFYLDWAVRKGFLDIVSSDEFSPDSALTVEQASCILSSYIEVSGVVLRGYIPSDEFADSDYISEWAKSSMETVCKYGLIMPMASGYIGPQRELTRAEAVVAVVRLAKAIDYDKKYEVPSSFTYESLMQGSYSLVNSHELDSISTVDSNIRYLLKNGKTELELDVDWEETWRAGSDYGDVYHDVLQNYPEFGLKYVTSEDSNGKLLLKFSGLPTNSEALSKYQKTALQSAIHVRNKLHDTGVVTKHMTQLEKARVYYDWVIENCDYDWESLMGGGHTPFAWMAYGPIIRGLATCQGYTAALNLFLRLEGIDCGTERNPYHIWSTAKLDGVLYHLDATWADMCHADADAAWAMTPEESLARYDDENPVWRSFLAETGVRRPVGT